MDNTFLPGIRSLIQEKMEETSVILLNPDGIQIVSLEERSGKWYYVVQKNWECGAVSPDESAAAIALCKAVKQVDAGELSVKKFIDTFYPEDENFYTRLLFFDKKVIQEREDGTLEMNIQFD